MAFLYIKALHIIFVVTWFAGLFYIVRLFVYFVETDKMKNQQEAFCALNISLCNVGCGTASLGGEIITLVLGSTLVFKYGFIPDWLWVKLGFVAFFVCLSFLLPCYFQATSEWNYWLEFNH